MRGEGRGRRREGEEKGGGEGEGEGRMNGYYLVSSQTQYTSNIRGETKAIQKREQVQQCIVLGVITHPIFYW